MSTLGGGRFSHSAFHQKNQNAELQKHPVLAAFADGCVIPLKKLSGFFSKNALVASNIIADFVQRRGGIKWGHLSAATWGDFYSAAVLEKCGCDKKGQFCAELLKNCERQSNGRGGDVATVMGNHAAHLIKKDFPNRERQLLIIGVKGSGKSSAIIPFFSFIPEFFVTRPSYGDTWPLPLHTDTKVVPCNDLRLEVLTVGKRKQHYYYAPPQQGATKISTKKTNDSRKSTSRFP